MCQTLIDLDMSHIYDKETQHYSRDAGSGEANICIGLSRKSDLLRWMQEAHDLNDNRMRGIAVRTKARCASPCSFQACSMQQRRLGEPKADELIACAGGVSSDVGGLAGDGGGGTAES